MVASFRFRIWRPKAMAPSTEPPSESMTKVAPARSWLCAKSRKWCGVSAVIAPAAEMKTLQFVPQASAGPCARNSNCIGNVRSEARSGAGNSKSGAAKASAIAIKRERLILPLLAAEPCFWRGQTTFWLGLGGA